jgi:DNA (cytosine-5)-methyltransferase 1
MRTHVDLFSGIGGFALAAQWAGVETIAFAEIDPYASRVLQRHWPNVRNYGDVRNLSGLSGWLVTGGVPCQPASIAGQRRGANDDRWLWPEALAAIERLQPAWLCLENPLGILSLEQSIMSFDLADYGNLVEAAIQSESDFWPALTGEVGFIFRDLVSSVEKLGYEVAPIVIPACGLGALHRRYRVWIMGHAKSVQPRQEQQSPRSNVTGLSGAESIPDANGGRAHTEPKCISERKNTAHANWNGEVRNVPFAVNNGSHRATRDASESGVNRTDDRVFIGSDWWAVEPDVGRVANGIPSRLDRLRCLGNAIVPQVAYQIIKRMIEAEERC